MANSSVNISGDPRNRNFDHPDATKCKHHKALEGLESQKYQLNAAQSEKYSMVIFAVKNERIPFKNKNEHLAKNREDTRKRPSIHNVFKHNP